MMIIRKRGLCGVMTLVLVLATWWIGSVAMACPLCKEAVGEGGASGASGLATGFFWSILAMLTVPFVLVGVVAYAIVSAYRRGAQQSAGAATHTPSAS